MNDRPDYLVRHTVALAQPNEREEPLVLIIEAIEKYVRWEEGMPEVGRGSWRDYVTGKAIGHMLDAFVELLNGPKGRLDAGTLDTWAREMATRIGYDMDRQEYIG
jgi:hypothetical protein